MTRSATSPELPAHFLHQAMCNRLMGVRPPKPDRIANASVANGHDEKTHRVTPRRERAHARHMAALRSKKNKRQS